MRPAKTKSATDHLPRMLRTAAVAAMLDLPERRVYELVRAGLIPHVRVGRSVRFNSRRLAEWIEAGGTGYGDKSE